MKKQEKLIFPLLIIYVLTFKKVTHDIQQFEELPISTNLCLNVVSRTCPDKWVQTCLNGANCEKYLSYISRSIVKPILVTGVADNLIKVPLCLLV